MSGAGSVPDAGTPDEVTADDVTQAARAEPGPPPPHTTGGDDALSHTGALTEVLRAMHDRRKAVAGDQPWSIAGSWRSFKANFVHATGEDGEQVAVKFGDGWSADDAHFVAAEVERVRSIFKRLPGGKVRVPRALGWSGEPAAVALRYVDGTNLFATLSDRSHPLWERGHERVEELIVRCGQAIGAYHAAEPAPDDPATAQVALDDLLTAARRTAVRRKAILEVEPRLERARGYRFSPNDFTIDARGRLVMLDPPHVRKFDYLQRDVSAFTFEMHRALVGDRPVSDTGDGSMLSDLRGAFLAGYAATGPSTLSTPLDVWMIRFYEVSRITGLAYARARSGRTGAATGALRWAVSVRRSLGPPPVS